MAETIHLHLVANGKHIKGESTQRSLERAETIECLSFSQGMTVDISDTNAAPVGRRRMGPITVRKRVDASSPLLIKALSENQLVQAVFRFYRPDPAGDGQTEQFYTIEVSEGRFNSIHQISPDTLLRDSVGTPPLEEISLVGVGITWT